MTDDFIIGWIIGAIVQWIASRISRKIESRRGVRPTVPTSKPTISTPEPIQVRESKKR